MVSYEKDVRESLAKGILKLQQCEWLLVAHGTASLGEGENTTEPNSFRTADVLTEVNIRQEVGSGNGNGIFVGISRDENVRAEAERISERLTLTEVVPRENLGETLPPVMRNGGESGVNGGSSENGLSLLGKRPAGEISGGQTQAVLSGGVAVRKEGETVGTMGGNEWENGVQEENREEEEDEEEKGKGEEEAEKEEEGVKKDIDSPEEEKKARRKRYFSFSCFEILLYFPGFRVFLS